MLVIIIILIGIICLLLYKERTEVSNNDVFEKKNICNEMHTSYEKYFKDLWTIEPASGSIYPHQAVGEVEVFYNKKRNTCLGAFRVYGSLYQYNYYNSYHIQDFLDGNEEIFECRWNNLANGDTKNYGDCEKMRKQKKIKLSK